jgi:hypothetical protein
MDDSGLGREFGQARFDEVFELAEDLRVGSHSPKDAFERVFLVCHSVAVCTCLGPLLRSL